MSPPSTRITRPTVLACAALACMLAACTHPRGGAPSRDAERQELIAEARAALRKEVRDAAPIPGTHDTLAVLVADGQRAAETRWLVLLARAGGGGASAAGCTRTCPSSACPAASCTGACPTWLPLRAADGTLVLDDNYLTLPADVYASDELAGARTCVTRY